MSASTRTLEMPALDELLQSDAPAHPAPPERYDPEPTTVAIPVIGAVESIVVDEPQPGVRSLESLTLSPRRAKAALWVLAVAAFAAGVNEGSVVALTPAIAAGLGIQVAQVGLLATAFALTVVVSAVPLTMLSSRFAARTTLTATFAVWTVGVTIAATAGSFAQLAAGRVVTAIAHGLFWGIVAPTAASLFAPHLRAMTVTRVLVGSAAAGVIGTPLVTLAGDTVGWHVAYWGLAVLGLALAIALAFVLPGRIDTGMDDSPEDKEERPTKHTIGDVPSLKHFIRVLGVTLAMQVGMAITWTYIVSFYTDAAGVPSSVVPLLFALGGLVGVASTLMIGSFLAKHAVQTVGLGVLGVGASWVLYAIGQPWAALLGQIVVSAGWAVLVTGLLNWAMRHTPWRTDIGSSLYMVTANIGAALGPLVGAALVSAYGLSVLPLVSLGLTVIAAVVVATVDPKVVRRLEVPRQVRMALQQREELRQRRGEWSRRTESHAHRPIAAAWAVGQNAAQQSGAEGRSRMATAWARPRVNALLAHEARPLRRRPKPGSKQAAVLAAQRAAEVARAAQVAAEQELARIEAIHAAAEEHVASSEAVLVEADGPHEGVLTPEEQVAALQALDPYRTEE
ncbi:MFS transporter [Demequina zhanjiangensis]|uniref:MFS transporter n=1 Tax=Demequina zhanjiangensis TaxID=3051659 RepID=A0ABT8G2Y2_9MICO|nr:MFS transporter [Demequina sp. SYSU T00b26]MDN4473507.1 MFS transporter [Demequina sp. SYSU T00b26]